MKVSGLARATFLCARHSSPAGLTGASTHRAHSLCASAPPFTRPPTSPFPQLTTATRASCTPSEKSSTSPWSVGALAATLRGGGESTKVRAVDSGEPLPGALACLLAHIHPFIPLLRGPVPIWSSVSVPFLSLTTPRPSLSRVLDALLRARSLQLRAPGSTGSCPQQPLCAARRLVAVLSSAKLLESGEHHELLVHGRCMVGLSLRAAEARAAAGRRRAAAAGRRADAAAAAPRAAMVARAAAHALGRRRAASGALCCLMVHVWQLALSV